MKGKEFDFTVTSLTDSKFRSTHTYGLLSRVEKWELEKVVYLLHQELPDNRNLQFLLSTIRSYYHEDDGTSDSAFYTAVAVWFPVVMNDFRGKRLSQKQKACLWIVSSFWHLYCGGPRVDTRLSKTRKIDPDYWKKSLFCPFCNQGYNPPEALSKLGQRAVLKAFSHWMSIHAKTCGEHTPKAKKAIAELEEGRKKDEIARAKFEAQQVALAKLGDIGAEVIRELNHAKAQAEKLQMIEMNRKYWQQQADQAHFNVLQIQAIENNNKPKVEPLSAHEQARLAHLVLATRRIEELLASIKGQRGVAAQRESLQKDLKSYTKERDQLEERRLIAGELDLRVPRR